MPTRQTAGSRRTLKIPVECAWCGQRLPVTTRVVCLTRSMLWIQVRTTLDLPICRACEAYARGLHRAERILWALAYALATPTAAILVLWWGVPLDRAGRALDIVVIVVTVAVLLAWAFHRGLAAAGASRWLARRTEERPPGYASETALPAEWVDGDQLRFYAPGYQGKVTALNAQPPPRDPPAVS